MKSKKALEKLVERDTPMKVIRHKKPKFILVSKETYVDFNVHAHDDYGVILELIHVYNENDVDWFLYEVDEFGIYYLQTKCV